MPHGPVTLIIYTTKYRLGGHQFPAVAETLADEKRQAAATDVVTRAVESKRDVLQAIAEIRDAGKKIGEFIFVGHSGMYGPMFGTVAFPEQFSPYEWEQMDIPFATEATAYFYCCRSARWATCIGCSRSNPTTGCARSPASGCAASRRRQAASRST